MPQFLCWISDRNWPTRFMPRLGWGIWLTHQNKVSRRIIQNKVGCTGTRVWDWFLSPEANLHVALPQCMLGYIGLVGSWHSLSLRNLLCLFTSSTLHPLSWLLGHCLGPTRCTVMIGWMRCKGLHDRHSRTSKIIRKFGITAPLLSYL